MRTVRSFPMKSFALSQQNLAVQAMWITAFAALTTIGAYIEIPQKPVPFTLQTFFVLLGGAVLGKRNGALSQLLYLSVGLLGLPVFSSGGFGLAKLLGPTGGYLMSFPIAAFVVGYLFESKKSFAWALLSAAIGSLVIFSLGTVHLYFVYYRDWPLALANGFFIFSVWDLVKVAAVASIASQISKRESGS